jgi:hypothetical protein
MEIFVYVGAGAFLLLLGWTALGGTGPRIRDRD